MLEDMAGPNQHIFIQREDGNPPYAARKGYKRGYQEFGNAKKLHPDRYSSSEVTVLTKDQILALYPGCTCSKP